jgi:Rhodopirellula transposase DDE domain
VLRSFKTVVQLIAATTTTTGLTVRAELDENKYPKGMKISDAKLAAKAEPQVLAHSISTSHAWERHSGFG